MKLKSGFMLHNEDGEQMMVDTKGRFSGLVRSNPTAAFIVEQLKKDTSEKNIVAALCGKYDVSEKTATADVKNILIQLRSIGAIDE